MKPDPHPAAADRQPNLLLGETSPYLLQHAYNPVEWHPWGSDAIERARALDRPIFLSIGYSACHWCHVMEHESFENVEIARLMNEYFVNIKVDREERPDLDQIYMSAVQALTRRGGWPMSVFLTPDLKPFFGGTYWPPVARMGMPGFADVVEQVHRAWVERRSDVERGAAELTNAVVQMGQLESEQSPLKTVLLENAERSLLRSADRAHGGFGGAPKFPHPMDIRVLLRTHRRFQNEDSLQVALLCLDKMAAGGIYDHLGSGFHRYSTDARWLVPHFEKMLYDNALLTSAYLEAFQLTGNENYARVARETLDYTLREMTHPDGPFYSTQDADSEGVEGKFFVWTEREIVDVLGPEDARLFNYCYDVTAEGNWEEQNILNRVKTHQQAARMLSMSEAELESVLERSRAKLYEARSKRIPPGRDEKILASWNGLMIAAMSQGARVLGQERYAATARQAADFVLAQMRGSSGRLLHSFKDGRARFNAYLEDYAFVLDGLAELYQATFDSKYVDAALELAETLLARFRDTRGGGFFFTSDDHEELITRQKDSQDNATPSGNGMAATALLKLARICGRSDLETRAVETLEMVSGLLAQAPMAGAQSLIALDFLLGPTHEVVLVEGQDGNEAAEMLRTIDLRFLPNKVLLLKSATLTEESIPQALSGSLAGKTAKEGRATAYACQFGTCLAPTTEISELLNTLESR
ncbi:MAG: thioredoxin domain-containing protein [Planctomycetaceae bacterium]